MLRLKMAYQYSINEVINMKRIEDIREYNYGYGFLEDKLIAVFEPKNPDYVTADLLIEMGADVNAEGKDDEENILSEVLNDNWQGYGREMVQTIEYFLRKGFDVSKKDGRYGAQCLWALTLSTFDRYMIQAIKILFDAGAKNVNISSNPDDNETPWGFISTEGSYQDTCEHDHHHGNIFEAAYQIYQAVEDGRDYSGIDSYEKVLGHRIIKILSAVPNERKPFFDQDIPNSKHKNCFTQNLYFVTDNGVLFTTQYVDFWFDRKLPDIEMIDVSSYFTDVVGETIKEFHFDHRTIAKGTTHYGQPIVTIKMGNGSSVTFSINFGEVRKEDRVAYFCLS